MRSKLMFGIWAACMVASLALFWIGVGQPYLKAREIAAEQITLSPDDPSTADLEARRMEEGVPNYWIGAALPAGILIASMLVFSRIPAKRE